MNNKIKALTTFILFYNYIFIILSFHLIFNNSDELYQGCNTFLYLLSINTIFIFILSLSSGYHLIKADNHSLKMNCKCFSFYYSVIFIISMVLFLKSGICDNYLTYNLNTVLIFIEIFNILFNWILQKQLEDNSPSIQVNSIRIHPLQMPKIKGLKIKPSLGWECPICLTFEDESQNNPTEIYLLDCSHSFHIRCIEGCLENNISRCPMCRLEMV